MDMRTGEIAPLSEFEKRGVDKKFLRPIGRLNDQGAIKPIDPRKLSHRVRQMVLTTGHGLVSRNSKCPCGSGKRFKCCCMMAE
jgi:uncharacterized protein YecA (UPF0149 family)